MRRGQGVFQAHGPPLQAEDPRLLQEELQPGLRAGFQEGRPVLPCLLLQAEGLPGKEERLLPERPRGRQGSPWKAPPRRWRCRGANPRLPHALNPGGPPYTLRGMVRVYGVPGCGPCEIVKMFLAQKGVPFEFVNAREDEEARKKVTALAGSPTAGVVLEWEGGTEVIRGFPGEPPRLARPLPGQGGLKGLKVVGLVVGGGPKPAQGVQLPEEGVGEGGGVLGIRLGHLLQEEGPGPVQKGQDLLQGKAPLGRTPRGPGACRP